MFSDLGWQVGKVSASGVGMLLAEVYTHHSRVLNPKKLKVRCPKSQGLRARWPRGSAFAHSRTTLSRVSSRPQTLHEIPQLT